MELERPILADTDFLSDHLAGTSKAKKAIHGLLSEGFHIASTVITVSELFFGRYRRKWKQRRSERLEELVASLMVIPFTTEHAREYGRIRADLVDRGLDIGFADTAIAAIARREDLTVLTGNIDHFQRIEGLTVRVY